MSAKRKFWELRYRSWPRGREVVEGYTLLVPVPADLPVFADISLQLAKQQRAADRVETIVIPDRKSKVVREIVRGHASDWPGSLIYSDLPPIDQILLPRLNDPSRYHGAQLIHGVSRARGSAVLLHDADLVMLVENFHELEFRMLKADSQLDVVGVEGAWDPWFAGRDRTLAATWEQIGRTVWWRSFPPSAHLGHEAVEEGESHVFDTTFLPQFQSNARSIALATDLQDSFVHFNYVISSFRKYENSKGVYHDDNFRILLIRLLADAFGSSFAPAELPSMGELYKALQGESDRVVYKAADRSAYMTFRTKLQRTHGSAGLASLQENMSSLLSPFDFLFDPLKKSSAN